MDWRLSPSTQSRPPVTRGNCAARSCRSRSRLYGFKATLCETDLWYFRAVEGQTFSTCNLKGVWCSVTHGGTLTPCAPASRLLNLKERFDCGKILILVSTSLFVLWAGVSVAEPSCPAVEFSGELIANSLKVYVALSISVLWTVCKVLVGHRMCGDFAVPCSIIEMTEQSAYVCW